MSSSSNHAFQVGAYIAELTTRLQHAAQLYRRGAISYERHSQLVHEFEWRVRVANVVGRSCDVPAVQVYLTEMDHAFNALKQPEDLPERVAC